MSGNVFAPRSLRGILKRLLVESIATLTVIKVVSGLIGILLGVGAAMMTPSGDAGEL